jgi:hypothetical protein
LREDRSVLLPHGCGNGREKHRSDDRHGDACLMLDEICRVLAARLDPRRNRGDGSPSEMRVTLRETDTKV